MYIQNHKSKDVLATNFPHAWWFKKALTGLLACPLCVCVCASLFLKQLWQWSIYLNPKSRVRQWDDFESFSTLVAFLCHALLKLKTSSKAAFVPTFRVSASWFGDVECPSWKCAFGCINFRNISFIVILRIYEAQYGIVCLAGCELAERHEPGRDLFLFWTPCTTGPCQALFSGFRTKSQYSESNQEIGDAD